MSRYTDISGGEAWIGDDHINEYFITIDDVTFSDIQGEDLAMLVVKAYNHLDLNGHRILEPFWFILVDWNHIGS